MLDCIDNLEHVDSVKEINFDLASKFIMMQMTSHRRMVKPDDKFLLLNKREGTNMARYIGIDLHTNSLTACYYDGKDYKFSTYETNTLGLSSFILTLRKTDLLAVESTGNSNYFYKHVIKSVKEIKVVSPGQFNVIRTSVKKTDKNDAKALAFYLSKDMLPESRVKTDAQLQVSRISSSREQLIKTRTSLINKLHGIFNSLGYKLKKETLATKKGLNSLLEYNLDDLTMIEVKIFKSQVEYLNQGIKEIDILLCQAGQNLDGFESIKSIKGIGEKSASILLSHIGDVNDFPSADKLASYFGIVPRVSNSNETEKTGRITKRGNKLARTTLVQCTLVAIRYSNYLGDFYRKIKQKKSAGKAIIATARKFLKTIYLTIKNNWIFEDFGIYKIKNV